MVTNKHGNFYLLLRGLLGATLLLGFAACSTVSKKSDQKEITAQSSDAEESLEDEVTTLPDDAEEAAGVSVEDIIQANEGLEEEGLEAFLDPQKTEKRPRHLRGHIPMRVNSMVRQWVRYFVRDDRERFQRFIDRGHKYRSLIQGILKQYRVPTELYFQAMIESGFVPRATSRANAVGVWQFVRPTGRRYGLRIDRYVDERRDVVRATHAAARHLSDLHDKFQSWYLALAAYNAGERRIEKAADRGNSWNFWTLVRRRVLPKETMNYVPKFLAAIIVGTNPAKFGFTAPAEKPLGELVGFRVPPRMHLRDVARLTDTSYDDLTELNPNLRFKVTPPTHDAYWLWIPASKKAAFVNNKKLFDRHQLALGETRAIAEQARSKRIDAAQGEYHRVASGETLVGLSKRYQIPVAHLKHLNDLQSAHIQKGMLLKVSPVPASAPTQATLVVPAMQKPASAILKRYEVRPGDNLTTVAKKFNTSVHLIKKLNGLTRNRIYAGQSLRISTGNNI